MYAQVVERQRHRVRSRHQLATQKSMEFCIAERVATPLGRHFVARKNGRKLPLGSGVVAFFARSRGISKSSPKSSVEFHSSGLLVLVLLVERGLLAEGVARSKQAPLKRLRR